MNGGRAPRLIVMWMLGLAAAALGLGGCQAVAPGGGSAGGEAQPRRLVASTEVSVPPGVDADQLTPLEGDALDHARMSLEQVLAELPEPDYLARAREHDPDPQQGEGGDADEPSVEIQRSYIAARQAWREERHHDAINQLDAALRLAPGQPDLLRLMARSYGAIGNRLRAALYLRQSLEVDPDDVESLFILGRLALEQDEAGEAIVLFGHALDVARNTGDDRAVSRAMLHYHLAAALLEAGYAAAAIDQHRLYLDHVERESSSSPQAQEAGAVDRQQATTWLAVGDAHHRLDDPAAALEAYEHAVEQGLGDQPALVHRLVYTHLRLGDPEPAKGLTIERVRTSGGDEPSLDLVTYLAEHGVSAGALTEELQRMYADEGQSGAMAMAVAGLLPPEQAVQLLNDHFAAHPADQRVYDHLLDHWLLPEGAAVAEPEAVHQAVATTAVAMAEAPSYGAAEQIALRLLEAAGDTAALLDAWDSMPDEQRERPMVRVIKGMALEDVGRTDAAVEAFEQALQADGVLALARLQLARGLVAKQEFERAARLLEPLEGSTDSVPVLLRVRVLAETGRADEALALLERVMRQQSQASTELVLYKARLQVRAGDARAAEQTLLDALNARPEEERIYSALFDLYTPGTEAAEQIGDWQRQWTRLVRRLLGTMPDSRLGRLIRSELLDAQGERAEAEALLKQLLDENPRDPEALERLLDVYVRANRRDEARALIESKLDAHPQDVALLAVAHRFYQQIGDRDQMLEVLEQMLTLESAGQTRAQNLAALYLQTDRPERAITVLEEALAEEEVDDPLPLVRMLWRALLRAEELEAAQRRLTELAERWPEHREELLFEQAMLAERMEDKQHSEALLLELLEHNPDHALANNALGYAWTLQHRELERAKAMIERAVDAEPDNAAYLDSMGWVYYKLGQFDEAVVWLRRSRAAEGGEYPVIVDHLGDALYRVGQTEEAVQAWQQAQALLNQEDFSVYQDPELDSLGETLTQKVEAVANDREPPVASLSEEGEAAAEEAAAEAEADVAPE